MYRIREAVHHYPADQDTCPRPQVPSENSRKMKRWWYRRTRYFKRQLKKLGTIIGGDEEESTGCESITIKTKGHDCEDNCVHTS